MEITDTLGILKAAHVDLILHQQEIDTTTPAGPMFFQVTGALAEFEREMIRARVMAGLERAKAKGRKLGRPAITPKLEKAIRDRLATGQGIISTAKALGVGNGTVHRIKREMVACADPAHPRPAIEPPALILLLTIRMAIM